MLRLKKLVRKKLCVLLKGGKNMPRYVFIHKSGKITRKTMTPSKATEYGEKTKSVTVYGLASRVVLPRKKRKKRKKSRKRRKK
jgi:hypothetical protein